MAAGRVRRGLGSARVINEWRGPRRMTTVSVGNSTQGGAPLPVVVCVAADWDLLTLLRFFCSTLPCRTHATDSAEEALRLIGSTPVSLVLADQRLKSMSGGPFLKEVARRSPLTVRVLLASIHEEQDFHENDQERTHVVINKPWHGPSFRRTILAILQWQEERRRMAQDPDSTPSYNTTTRSVRALSSPPGPADERRDATGDTTHADRKVTRRH